VTWAILFFVVLLFHIDNLTAPSNLDDLSVYRANAYISRFPHDPLLDRLTDHLQQSKAELLNWYPRYQWRLLKSSDDYIAQQVLVRMFENLPLYSAYQSVFLADLCLHMLAVTAVFLAFGTLFGSQSQVLCWTFLLSLLPVIFSPSFHLGGIGDLFPFQNISHHVFWYVAVPRGAALTFFFAALLLWLHTNESALSRTTHIGFTLLLVAASLLSHKSMGFLLLGTTLCFELGYRLCGCEPQKIAHRVGFWRFFLLLNGTLVLLAMVKLLCLFLAGFTEIGIFTTVSIPSSIRLSKKILKLLSWTIATNLLAYCWLKIQQDANGIESSLLRAGNHCFRYFVPFAIIGIGLNIFHPGEWPMTSTWHIITEASVRIIGLPHILWWMIFGIWLYAKLVSRHKKAFLCIPSIIFLACITTVTSMFLEEKQSASISDIFNRKNLTIISSELLVLPGIDMYEDEILYFHAIANELKKKNTNPR
jgi:hypothetical protein